MKVYGIIGWQNSGKTTLVEALLAEFIRRGVSVSTVKHSHHAVELDQPGKDSHRHRLAGAQEVVLASAAGMALLRQHRGAEPALAEILTRLAPVDLVLVEGYKRDNHPKIEVWRAGVSERAPICHGDASVRGLASDRSPGLVPVPWLDLNDAAAIADFIWADLHPLDPARPHERG